MGEKGNIRRNTTRKPEQVKREKGTESTKQTGNSNQTINRMEDIDFDEFWDEKMNDFGWENRSTYSSNKKNPDSSKNVKTSNNSQNTKKPQYSQSVKRTKRSKSQKKTVYGGNVKTEDPRKKKKKRGHGGLVFFMLILLIAAVGVGGSYLWIRSQAKMLEKAWEKRDAEAFRALFTDHLDEQKDGKEESGEKNQKQEEESAGEENLRYISEEEYLSIVRNPMEESEAESKELDLLETMMEYGTLKVKVSSLDTVVLDISVPDTTILIEELKQEGISGGKESLEALIDKMKEKSTDLVMRDSTVTVKKSRKFGKTSYLLSEELADGLYGGFLSGFSDVYNSYYEALGGTVR